MYKLRMPIERSGFVNFEPLKISDISSSLFTIFTIPVMRFPAGL